MRSAIDQLTEDYEISRISRRGFLMSMSALMAAPRVFAQGGGAMSTIKTVRINSCGIAVTDVGKSVEWYQKLFGLPVRAMQGQTAILGLLDSPRYLSISPRGNSPAAITFVGVAVENYDPDRLVATLNSAGVKAEVRTRGADRGGAQQGTKEVFFTDPAGGTVYLEHADNGGGGGIHGEVLKPLDIQAAKRAPMPAVGYSHMSGRVNPREFYEKVFGMMEMANQGPNTIMSRIGRGPDFLTTSGGPTATSNRIAGGGHFCFTMQGFDPNMVVGILADNGVEPMENGGGANNQPKANSVRVRLRQKINNGGGPTHPLGTYELYIQDIDNIGLQMQDVTYCGGSGANGQICP